MSEDNNNFVKEVKDPHPCVHCQKPCFGAQCKECHLKMIADREGECIDCKNKFMATRKDGSKRKRCFDCQKEYNKTHIGICPVCSKDYHAYLPDGRIFDKCFDCYQASFHKCQNCDNTIKEEFTICGDCFHKERLAKKTTVYPVQDCKTKGCVNKTTYTFCKSCNDANRTVNSQYVVSTCQELGCGVRMRGQYKYCEEHSS